MMKQFCRNSFLIVAGCLALASGVSVLAPTTLEAASIKENDKATNRLFQAVYADDLTSAQASVAEGADIDARDRWGMTPTDVAIDRSHFRNRPLPRLVRQRPARSGRTSRTRDQGGAEPAAVSAAPAKNSANQSAGASKAAASGGAGGKPRPGRQDAASASTAAPGAADSLPLAAGAQPARPGRPASPTHSIRQCRPPAPSCVRKARAAADSV